MSDQQKTITSRAPPSHKAHDFAWLDLRNFPVGGIIHLAPHLPALDTPGKVRDGDQDEAVARLQDTGHGVVPGQEGGDKAKGTAGSDEALVDGAGGRAVIQPADGEHEEGDVEGEEEEEEGDGGAGGAH